MPHTELQERVYRVNMQLVAARLVVLTWGNASAVDRKAGVVAIKPSGIPYETMRAADIVLLSLETGQVVEGSPAKLRPSSDTPTHLHLYKSFESIGGVVHMHSTYATSFAQAQREIPCLGTTHADAFYGCVPLTRPLTGEEIQGEYELNTGRVITQTLKERKLDPLHVPGILVASHGPFAWGGTVEKAIENAITMEAVAEMAMHTYAINPGIGPVPQALMDKHFQRKHGPRAYYGQK